jgi:hypothetical protein
VVRGGQYTVPTGVFYGGTGPVWSHRFLRDFCTTALAGAQKVTIIDLHTGLGPWGHGELIASASPGEPLFDRADALWGDVRSMMAGDASRRSWPATGWPWPTSWPPAEVTPITIEYGTVTRSRHCRACAGAWLHAHGNPPGRGSRHPRS